ncbi:MAG: GNAT family N-acetyltransferase [Clostridia bacterium]|nr:GNAT family N-acetyltransferase [Clostridia bacterium]
MIEIKRVSADCVYEIRKKILRPNAESLNAVHFDGDFAEGTCHFCAYIDGNVASCVSVMPVKNDGSKAFQMRGLATYPEYRKQGLAKALVKAAEYYSFYECGCDLLWLNARVDVSEFYVRLGYTACGEPFMIPDVCMHIKMCKDKPEYEKERRCCCDNANG